MESINRVIGSVRLFSTSAINNARAYRNVVNRQLKKPVEYQIGDIRNNRLWVPKEVSKYPAYPYGESRIFKRSDRGLFGGQVITTGNKVSEMGNRTRRTWLPNVISKNLWSSALNRMIKMKLTARVLRTITKEGGLDNYVTKEKEARIKELGIFGWKLRHDILKAREISNKPLPYKFEGEYKVYYEGTYKGEEIKLIRGKREILKKLFPYVKLNSPEGYSFSTFNIAHCKKSYEELVKECESLNVDLSEVKL